MPARKRGEEIDKGERKDREGDEKKNAIKRNRWRCSRREDINEKGL